VADSGPGFAKDGETLLAESEGVGLSTTERRLDTLYGDAHTFELGTAAEGGARVTIQIPLDADPAATDLDAERDAAPVSDPGS
jgi:sensor histidine kinase YesM